jgi:hypothetical protein
MAILDLSTIDLPTGTYDIKVIARGNGYHASVPEIQCTYTVAPKEMFAPTIAATSVDGEIEITDNESNDGNTVSYNIYKADGTFVKNVAYESNPQLVDLDKGTQYYVTAVSEYGVESPISNIAKTKQCFVAGTPVLMSDGSYKMIETIEVGDKVQAYDLETNEYCEGEVSEVVTGYTDRIAMVLFADSNYIAMAEGHPLYTEDGWHSITNKDGYPTLVVGDKVLSINGYVEIIDIQVVDAEPTLVYSLSIGGVLLCRNNGSTSSQLTEVSTLSEQDHEYQSSPLLTAADHCNNLVYFTGIGCTSAATHGGGPL